MEVVRSYFLANVTETQKMALNAQKVIFADFELGGEQGIVLDETQLLNGLRTLNKVILAELPTETDGAFKILTADITELDPEYAQGNDLGWHKNKYVIPAEKAKFLKEKILESLRTEETAEEEGGPSFVRIRDWDGDGNQNEFRQLAEKILLPKIRTEIIISVPHGEKIRPVEDDNFYIYIWSAPPESKSRNVSTPPTIWGTRVACGDESFAPSGRGIIIKDDKYNYAVTELVNENTLYIFHDLCHYGRDSELEIFRKILEAVVAPEVFSQLTRFRRPAPVKKETKFKELKHEEIEINKAITMELPGFSQEERALVRKVYAPIIARELITKIQRGVCLHKNRSQRQKPLPFYDETFHIFFVNPSAREGGEWFFSSNKFWGISLPVENMSYYPITREGVVIYDDAGQRVGQIIGGRNLYIPYFLFSNREALQRVFVRLMEEAARLFVSTVAERQKREEEIRAIQGRAYAAICWQHQDLIRQGAAAELEDVTKQVKNLQTQMVMAIRKYDALKGEVEGNKGMSDEQEKLVAEFEKMGQQKKIRRIRLISECFIVETDTLYYNQPTKKETRLIGAFQIVIPFRGSCDDIRFFNMTQRVNGFNAPNVSPDGLAFFGSQLQETIPQLIARFNFEPLINMCIVFLESAIAHSSVGRQIEDWPIIKR